MTPEWLALVLAYALAYKPPQSDYVALPWASGSQLRGCGVTYPVPLTRPQRDRIRREIDTAKRARLTRSQARLNPDRPPHPRRDYWRAYKAAQRAA